MAENQGSVRVDLKKEKQKRWSRDKLFARISKGIKSILKALDLKAKLPKVTKDDTHQFSFLSRSTLDNDSSNSSGNGVQEVTSRGKAVA